MPAVRATTHRHARPRPTLRRMIYAELNPASRKNGVSAVNIGVIVAVVASVVCTVLHTEPTISHGHGTFFNTLEIGFAWIFAFEYALRVWVAVEQPGHEHPLFGRLRWMLTPMALIDLLSWAPTILLTGVASTQILRIFRLARILRLAKLGRMTRAWSLIGEAVAARRFELLIVALGGVFAILLVSTGLYIFEGPTQKDAFGSIPRAIWWSVATLTTIGRGAAYPQTPIGQGLAVLTAIIGIGLVAAPTGILAGAFSEAFHRHRNEPHPEDP